MNYVSTRGQSPAVTFEDALLSGPAPDGGLYVPEAWPRFAQGELEALRGKPYADVVAAVMRKFADGDWRDISARVAREVYPRFAHKDVAPLVELAPNRKVLELFHGPTLAFKDFALQLVAPLMSEALRRWNARALVLVATSGDTGAAAVAALAGRTNIDVVVLHPKGRISDVQRRQMTTVRETNVRNVAIEGTFDDAQALVKALFSDAAFTEKHKLAAVNSINWVRVAAQVAYYAFSSIALGSRPIVYAVPTGNFGDVFAGYVAKQMGVPIRRLIVGTNVNDILVRALKTGVYARGAVRATMSPAMDIQVASNFERLIFDAHERDTSVTRELLVGFAKSGSLSIKPVALEKMQQTFDAVRVDEAQTMETIRRVYAETGYLIDPHTAVGVAAARDVPANEEVVMLATAHPAKFPEAVESATGVRPHLPDRLNWILTAPERFDTLPNDAQALKRYVAA